MSTYAFARKFDLSASSTRDVGPDLTPSRGGVGADPLAKGVGSDLAGGVGALAPETQALVQAGAIGGVMFYGVILAIKGSLLAGGAAFIAGPMVVSYVLSKAMNY